ncbi:MAG: ABC transporter substrate-binding protein [Granulosicoccus sp.]
MEKPAPNSRRTFCKTVAKSATALAAPSLLPALSGYGHAQTSEPLRVGLQAHRTGIGASYGRWYERTSQAAVARINSNGGINGRKVELIVEDDGTDPVRGADVVRLLTNKHQCDVIFGTLFSHVVAASAPVAGELKVPYFIVSETHSLAAGEFNRYVLQPGMTDVRSQVLSMAPFISGNLGENVAIIYPDYAFGHNHRDFLTPAIEQQGGNIVAKIGVPPTETSFRSYFEQIPENTDVLYHVMVGPTIMSFIQQLGQYYENDRPEIFGFIDSLEAVDLQTPGLEFLEGTYFWEGHPRYHQAEAAEFELEYRKAVSVDLNGASTTDQHDIATFSHMYGCWETLNIIKAGMQDAFYKTKANRSDLIEAIEAMTYFPQSLDIPQGPKVFNGMTHQTFGHQYISRLENGKLQLAHTTGITDTFYPDAVDYTDYSF